jgi:hypothetical protein
MPIEIREQREYDVEELQRIARGLGIADIESDVILSHAEKGNDQKGTLMFVRERVLAFINGKRDDQNISYVAMDGEKIAGFLSYDRDGPESMGEPIYLNVMFTDPQLPPEKRNEAKKLLDRQYVDAE